MSILRTVLVVAAAIVLAILALNVIAFVTGLIMKVVMLALFVAAIYVVFLVARSALRGRTQHS